ncbi:MAG TPA: hypothetical protein VI282_11865, partial [Verrucomicrobiae bacterium]
RGQFDSFQPTAGFGRSVQQCSAYVKGVTVDLGPFYVVAAMVPFVLVRKMSNLMRRWLIGILWMWILVSAQTIVGLNLEASEMLEYQSLFAPAHALLVMVAGVGLMVAIGIFVRKVGGATAG